MTVLEMDEWVPTYSTREVQLSDLPEIWRSLPRERCFGFTWNDSGDEVIIVSVCDGYSTVSIVHDDTFYDLAISPEDGWREIEVLGEWRPWPVRSILPRDMGLEVLLRCDEFDILRREFSWREQDVPEGDA